MTDLSAPAGAPHGLVFWITGRSGSGKTTLAKAVTAGLRQRGRAALMLDGDVLRGVLGGHHGHSREDRLHLAMTYGRLAAEVAAQGIDAVCATISMFHSVRDWNRTHIPGYREIYLRVPQSELERRDPRGLYAQARAKEIDGMVGLDQAMEEPLTPDLVLDNHGTLTPDHAVARILRLLEDAEPGQ